jgi:hypothetical protein
LVLCQRLAYYTCSDMLGHHSLVVTEMVLPSDGFIEAFMNGLYCIWCEPIWFSINPRWPCKNDIWMLVYLKFLRKVVLAPELQWACFSKQIENFISLSQKILKIYLNTFTCLVCMTKFASKYLFICGPHKKRQLLEAI